MALSDSVQGLQTLHICWCHLHTEQTSYTHKQFLSIDLIHWDEILPCIRSGESRASSKLEPKQMSVTVDDVSLCSGQAGPGGYLANGWDALQGLCITRKPK